ncbi:hypothetical protein THOG11_120191 [Vibrio harveyi]|nr:hypothetical protein TH15OA1_410193 [Vibrio harveyi]CAH1548601.1 hypothetical protein THOD03_110191 [Vibrio harveyi]CAH1553165.1 hypothetical protein THOG11_120191 [Vibrio harveyi]
MSISCEYSIVIASKKVSITPLYEVDICTSQNLIQLFLDS